MTKQDAIDLATQLGNHELLEFANSKADGIEIDVAANINIKKYDVDGVLVEEVSRDSRL